MPSKTTSGSFAQTDKYSSLNTVRGTVSTSVLENFRRYTLRHQGKIPSNPQMLPLASSITQFYFHYNTNFPSLLQYFVDKIRGLKVDDRRIFFDSLEKAYQKCWVGNGVL